MTRHVLSGRDRKKMMTAAEIQTCDYAQLRVVADEYLHNQEKRMNLLRYLFAPPTGPEARKFAGWLLTIFGVLRFLQVPNGGTHLDLSFVPPPIWGLMGATLGIGLLATNFGHRVRWSGRFWAIMAFAYSVWFAYDAAPVFNGAALYAVIAYVAFGELMARHEL
jgi:hypothetical protein